MSEVASKVLALMKEVGAIPKNSVNQFHKYKYRSHEDLMNALQPALIKTGLLLVPKEKQFTLVSPGHVICRIIYCLTDGKESVTFEGLGEGQDVSKEGKAGDKAIYKAQTGALKYALNDMLALGTEDDAEKDHATHNRPAPGASSHEAAHDILADWAAKMDECSTLAELQTFWGTVPRNLQPGLAKAKEAAKQRIGGKL